MLQEILELFQLKPGMTVVDGTLGMAGHSSEFAKAIAPGGTIVGFDWDSDMFAIGQSTLQSASDVQIRLFNEPFTHIEERLKELNLKADAILLDLGLNSGQIDDAERGISFAKDGPLDMRMDRRTGEPASALLNRMAPGEIERILLNYGGENWARIIAREIVKQRAVKPLKTTNDLVDIILGAIPKAKQDKRIHPATRTFQALRIVVNHELEILEEALQNCANSLNSLGVLGVLSYHSGEDRIVKHFFREMTSQYGEMFEEVYKKPVQPSEAEIRSNARSRSAKLRALKRK